MGESDMFHLKNIIAGVSIMLAGAFLPVLVPSPAGEAQAKIPAELEPNGYCDLYWGESLEEIQNEYEVRFVNYQNGYANYSVIVDNAHGEMGFNEKALAICSFKAKRLFMITLLSPKTKEAAAGDISRKYGPPDSASNGIYIWISPKSYLYVKYFGPFRDNLIKSQIILVSSNDAGLLR